MWWWWWWLSGISWVSRYQKGKTNLDLMVQDTVNGSGISWAICKYAPCPRHIIITAPHHSVFYRLDALAPPQTIVKALKAETVVELKMVACFHSYLAQCSKLLSTSAIRSIQPSPPPLPPSASPPLPRKMTDWVNVLSPNWHKIGHFRDILPSQSLEGKVNNWNPEFWWRFVWYILR